MLNIKSVQNKLKQLSLSDEICLDLECY